MVTPMVPPAEGRTTAVRDLRLTGWGVGSVRSGMSEREMECGGIRIPLCVCVCVCVYVCVCVCIRVEYSSVKLGPYWVVQVEAKGGG